MINREELIKHGYKTYDSDALYNAVCLYQKRIKDDKGTHGWYVADKEDNPVVDKEMSLLAVAAYAGIDVSGLE